MTFEVIDRLESSADADEGERCSGQKWMIGQGATLVRNIASARAMAPLTRSSSRPARASVPHETPPK
jgi:hypothetical protein